MSINEYFPRFVGGFLYAVGMYALSADCIVPLLDLDSFDFIRGDAPIAVLVMSSSLIFLFCIIVGGLYFLWCLVVASHRYVVAGQSVCDKMSRKHCISAEA